MDSIYYHFSEEKIPITEPYPSRNIKRKFLKADFHSVENVARSTFSARFLLNCSPHFKLDTIEWTQFKRKRAEKSIARHFPPNGIQP